MARLLCAAICLISGAITQAQSVTPANWTNATTMLEYSETWRLELQTYAQYFGAAAVLPITELPSNMTRQGGTLLVNFSNALNFSSADVALISCDPQPGFAQPFSLLSAAAGKAPQAIVLYSIYSDYCNVTNNNLSYPYIFSIKQLNDSQQMQQIVAQYAAHDPNRLTSTLALLTESDASASNTTNPNEANPNGAPTTAIAMIILYTITGVITLLFLSIIVTGAVRAHRHPERYGLRAGLGRPRRSRAHGLARAMLDSLPIVKFGEREEDRPKPSEIELGQAGNSPVEATGAGDVAASTEHPRDASSAADEAAAAGPAASDAHSSSSTAAPPASGIAPAAAIPLHEEAQGCSICTDDFELGQDQRVLPCDHRFHPACIDPWLLNVSGTCPLCRIDLQPRRSGEGDDDDDDDEANRDSSMAPPLGVHANDPSASHRLSIRRSIMIGLMGLGRPESMSREERVLALRRLRGQQAAQRRGEEMASVVATPEEERRWGPRLREMLGVRGRRGGDGGAAGVPAAATTASPPPAAAPTPVPVVHTAGFALAAADHSAGSATVTTGTASAPATAAAQATTAESPIYHDETTSHDEAST